MDPPLGGLNNFLLKRVKRRRPIQRRIDHDISEACITYEQMTAIERPCRLAVETMHPRFRHSTGVTIVILTVNSGYE
jgi:hypothetical protein